MSILRRCAMFCWTKPRWRAGLRDVRHQIGRRLFQEARYYDAAAEFEWASDPYRTAGRDNLSKRSHQAMKRAQEVCSLS